MTRRLTYANVMSTVAVFIALGGTSVAAVQLTKNSVKSRHIARNAVDSNKVKDGSLRAKDFRRGELKAGPAGPQGPAGPAGPAGPPALARSSINVREFKVPGFKTSTNAPSQKTGTFTPGVNLEQAAGTLLWAELEYDIRRSDECDADIDLIDDAHFVLDVRTAGDGGVGMEDLMSNFDDDPINEHRKIRFRASGQEPSSSPRSWPLEIRYTNYCPGAGDASQFDISNMVVRTLEFGG